MMIIDDSNLKVAGKPFSKVATVHWAEKCKFTENQDMSTVELRKRLIDKIQKTENKNLLEEASRLLDLETDNIDIYKLTEDQRKAVNEAREQINKGNFLTDEQANKETDEWLNK